MSVFFIFVLSFFSSIISFKCDHDSVYKDLKPLVVDLSNSPKKLENTIKIFEALIKVDNSKTIEFLVRVA